MLKRLLNSPERITYGRLREVCARHAAEVHAKVRLADVLPIEDSGLPRTLYEFALQSHYDFVITGRNQAPLFAVEFDGPQHGDSPQAERDAKKDHLSRQFRIPLLRVRADDLSRTEWHLDRLTELIERWFANHTEFVAGAGNMQLNPTCPLCGDQMVERHGKYGRFLGCARYPACTGTCDLPRPPNRNTASGWRKPLIAGSLCAALVAVALALPLRLHFGSLDGGGRQQPLGGKIESGPASIRSSMTLPEKLTYASALKESDYPTCPSCGKGMVLRHHGRTGDPFFGCSDFPDCRGSRDVQYPK